MKKKKKKIEEIKDILNEDKFPRKVLEKKTSRGSERKL